MIDYKGYEIYEEEREGITIYSIENGLSTIESRSFRALVVAIDSLPILERTTTGEVFWN